MYRHIPKLSITSSRFIRSMSMIRHIQPNEIKMRSPEEVIVRLGVIADVQFAPKNDTPNFTRNRTRRYHRSLEVLSNAIRDWNRVEVAPTPLFTKSERNPFSLPHGDKPFGCMCETEHCITIKCKMRTDNFEESSLVTAGVLVEHPTDLAENTASLSNLSEFSNGINVGRVPLIPCRPIDAVLQLGDLIDGSNNTLHQHLYAPREPCTTACMYCEGTNSDDYDLSLIHLIHEVPCEEGAGHSSTLTPPPCPTLVKAIHESLTKNSTTHPPSYATSLSYASVFARIHKQNNINLSHSTDVCMTPHVWHHAVGNHEFMNLHRDVIYKLYGRGVVHGDIVPFPKSHPSHLPIDTEQGAVTSGRYGAVEILTDEDVFPAFPSLSSDYTHTYVSRLTPPHSENGKNIYFIMLDAYAISLLGNEESSVSHQQARSLLFEHNSNIASGKGGDWSKGLKGSNMRYVPYNGAIGEKQLDWLDTVLDRLPTDSKAIIACHISADPKSTGFSTTLWDRDDLLSLFDKHKGKVVMYLSGHDHDGGYHYCETSGTHHLTLSAPIECREGEDAYCLLDIYKDGVQVYGSGKIQDMWITFPEIL